MLTLLLFLLLPFFVHATTHAVIMAGSSGFENYRHHADVCHAFHLLRRSGVSPQNIIMMSDVANDPMNPFPGRLFNQPSTRKSPGHDVYQSKRLYG